MQDDKLNAGVVDAGDETMSEAKVIPENQEAPKAEKDTAPADEPKADEANEAGATGTPSFNRIELLLTEAT